MVIFKHTSIIKTFLAFATTVPMLLLIMSMGTHTAQALSCLNPTEMINEYVSDERFSIARVTTGDLETTGAEHTQIVTITEPLKGTVDSPVSFTYDETWQYLCTGAPAQTGTEVVYVTSEGRVTQVINLDTPLYDTLITALADSPKTGEEETKRTLMQQVIGLLQQLIALLQGEAGEPVTEPDPGTAAEALVGMTQRDAETYAQANNLLFRIVEIDGEPQPVTEDYRPGRINASVVHGSVASYTIEGEGNTEADTGPHDDIIGMTQAEAEVYAEANEVDFRIGRIDEEYLALTMDYRPGRITAEIEDGLIVAYSIE